MSNRLAEPSSISLPDRVWWLAAGDVTVWPERADPLGSLRIPLLPLELSYGNYSPVKSINKGFLLSLNSSITTAPCIFPGPDSCLVLAKFCLLRSIIFWLWSSFGLTISTSF